MHEIDLILVDIESGEELHALTVNAQDGDPRQTHPALWTTGIAWECDIPGVDPMDDDAYPACYVGDGGDQTYTWLWFAADIELQRFRVGDGYHSWPLMAAKGATWEAVDESMEDYDCPIPEETGESVAITITLWKKDKDGDEEYAGDKHYIFHPAAPAGWRGDDDEPAWELVECPETDIVRVPVFLRDDSGNDVEESGYRYAHSGRRWKITVTDDELDYDERAWDDCEESLGADWRETYETRTEAEEAAERAQFEGRELYADGDERFARFTVGIEAVNPSGDS